MNLQTFPGFDHSAEELSAYAFCIDIFVISLTSWQIIRYCPQDAEAFRRWLDANNIRDITDEAGSLVINYYHRLK